MGMWLSGQVPEDLVVRGPYKLAVNSRRSSGLWNAGSIPALPIHLINILYEITRNYRPQKY